MIDVRTVNRDAEQSSLHVSSKPQVERRTADGLPSTVMCHLLGVENASSFGLFLDVGTLTRILPTTKTTTWPTT